MKRTRPPIGRIAAGALLLAGLAFGQNLITEAQYRAESQKLVDELVR
jgi:hypothetical protein